MYSRALLVFSGILASAFLFNVAATLASDQIVYSDDATKSCLNAATTPDAQNACIGLSMQACTVANDYGSTTTGMNECAGKETDFWDKRLNALYASYLESAEAIDKEDAASGNDKIADALRDMQRAWIPFRDATCAFQYSLGRGGTIASNFSTGCYLDMTAEQYLYLQNNAGPDLEPEG